MPSDAATVSVIGSPCWTLHQQGAASQRGAFNYRTQLFSEIGKLLSCFLACRVLAQVVQVAYLVQRMQQPTKSVNSKQTDIPWTQFAAECRNPCQQLSYGFPEPAGCSQCLSGCLCHGHRVTAACLQGSRRAAAHNATCGHGTRCA
jgi:hypothetical protein